MRTTLLLLLLTHAPASAQDVTPTFHAEAGAQVMLTPSLRDRFDWGGAGTLRAGLEVIGPLAFQASFGTAWFPVNGQIAGNLYSIELGARGFFRVDPVIGGPFVDFNAGLGLTGDLVRFTFDAAVGWDFFPHPAFGVGPVLRYVQIVQGDEEPLGGDDSHVLSFGVNATLRIDLGGPPPVTDEPEPDTDGDGVADSRDRCPAELEDVDGHADDDGCPDPDNDGDGVPDEADRCPGAAEILNGFEDEDGCPDAAPVVEGPRAPEPERLPQTVQFRLGSDRISARFVPEIQAVCATVQSRPGVRVRVVGHADEQGTPAANHRLGASRAGAVAEQLVLCGVSPERISSISHGDTRRVCSDASEDCRLRNRRVEFEILTE